MTFRKNHFMFLENVVVNISLALLSFTMIPVVGVLVSVVFAALFIILLVVTLCSQNEFITIDETGICCYLTDKLLWFHSWSSIVALKHSTRLRMPTVEIVIATSEMSDSCLPSGHYFQLCQSAKLAIKKYYSSLD